jgi:hypothetical protein
MGSGPMTSNSSPRPKSYTPPKAKQTPSKAELERQALARANRQANLQWAAAIIVGLVILGLVFVFGSGTGGNLDHVRVGGHG